MNSYEKQECQKYSQVLRAGRRSRGVSQADLASAIGVSQGQLSKLEKGVTVMSAPAWFRICEVLDIPPETGLLGYIDWLKPCTLSNENRQGAFKIPKRYSYLQGSTARVFRPFLSHFARQLGEKKMDEFIRFKNLDPDYFTVIDHSLNFNFNTDLTHQMMSSGLLDQNGLKQVAALAAQEGEHGLLGQLYRKATSPFEILEVFQNNYSKYTVNWDFEFNYPKKNVLEIVSTSAPHLKEFNIDQNEQGILFSEYLKEVFIHLFERNNFRMAPSAFQTNREGGLKTIYRLDVEQAHPVAHSMGN